MLRVSVGIPAFNEEANIAKLLDSLLSQDLKEVTIEEIVVVASGCTDQTVPIVERYLKIYQKIKLIKQDTRKGKTTADNILINIAKCEILVLVNADTLPEIDCIEKLIRPFKNKKIGITSVRVVPLNSKCGLSGYFSWLWWEIFHQVATKSFRAGEVLAFRRIINKIPEQIGSDELYLINAILEKGYRGKYISNAIVKNMGPRTIGDVLSMRRRQNCHTFQILDLGLKAYYPKTMENLYVLKLLVKSVNWFSFQESIFTVACILLEGISRMLGYLDLHLMKRNYLIWPRCASTKRLVNNENK